MSLNNQVNQIERRHKPFYRLNHTSAWLNLVKSLAHALAHTFITTIKNSNIELFLQHADWNLQLFYPSRYLFLLHNNGSISFGLEFLFECVAHRLRVNTISTDSSFIWLSVFIFWHIRWICVWFYFPPIETPSKICHKVFIIEASGYTKLYVLERKEYLRERFFREKNLGSLKFCSINIHPFKSCYIWSHFSRAHITVKSSFELFWDERRSLYSSRKFQREKYPILERQVNEEKRQHPSEIHLNKIVLR